MITNIKTGNNWTHLGLTPLFKRGCCISFEDILKVESLSYLKQKEVINIVGLSKPIVCKIQKGEYNIFKNKMIELLTKYKDYGKSI